MSDIYRELEKSMPVSHKTYERNHQLLSQEVVDTVFLPYPFYVREARGSRIVDVDDKEYIDLTMGFGPLLLGHGCDVVGRAIEEATDAGILFGLPTASQGDLAELLVDASPCAEQVVFCNTGTEATMYAIRAARAAMRRTKVALFHGSYHGAHDTVLLQGVLKPDPHRPRAVPKSMGIPQETTEQVLMLPYRDPAAFDLIEEHKDELALVMIEPVQSSNPRLDVGPFLQELRQVCSRSGVLLVFDEVLTGFRLAWGGGQERFGVTPDLATYGKILGGGLPIGAIAGPRELMSVFDYLESATPIFAGGTFAGNPLSMRAGIAMLRHLKARPEIYADLTRKAQHLSTEVNRFLQKEDYPAQLLSAESLFLLVFSREPVEHGGHGLGSKAGSLQNRFYAHLLRNGVIVPGLHLFFLSAAHSDGDVEQVARAFKKSFRELRVEGAI